MARLTVCGFLVTIVALTTPEPGVACLIRPGYVEFFGTASAFPVGSDWSVGIHFGEMRATRTIGIFAGTPAGTVVPYADFVFRPSLPPNPVSPLWTIGDHSFTVTRINWIREGDGGLSFIGLGSLTGPGTLPRSKVKWRLATYGAVGSPDRYVVSTVHQQAPEPTTIALVGLGVAGALGLARRRRRQPPGQRRGRRSWWPGKSPNAPAHPADGQGPLP